MEAKNDRATTPLLMSDEEDTYYAAYDDDDLSAAAKLRERKRRINQCIKLMCAVLVIVVIGVLTFALSYGIKNSDKGKSQDEVYAHAAVASDVTLCSQIGSDILQKKGGNAVDAAIATLLCMGLADPQSMGIGGGFFMTIYNSTTQTSYTIDAREVAPLQANESMFYGKPNDASEKGGLCIAVPGELRGYEMAYQKYGTPGLWKDIFQPAIDMAEKGFTVPRSLAKALEDYAEAHTQAEQQANAEFQKTYINPETGTFFKEGETIKQPVLAETLKVVQKDGVDAFYNGSLTQNILADMLEHGSDAIITEEDLIDYQPLHNDAMQMGLREDFTMYAPDAPSSGLILMFMLKLLDGYQLTPESIANEEARLLTYHRIVETFKFAYAKRTFLGDPNFVDISSLVKNLTSEDYIKEIRGQIWDNQTHPFMYYGPSYAQPNKTSTAHLSVVDANGNAVSVTSTVNLRFGSEIIGSRTGILFNDEMDDFATTDKPNDFGVYPSPNNKVTAGKRPVSSMCPIVIVDKTGQVRLVLGAAGGSRITTATAFIATHVLWLGKNIKEAIDMPRLHNQLLPWVTDYETGFDKTVIDGLKQKGHNVTEVEKGKSIVQGIVRLSNGKLHANSDERKGGHPAGY